jgi:hypothetical protein
MARLCGRGSMAGSGYLFLPPVNGNSTVVPERHQVGCRRGVMPVEGRTLTSGMLSKKAR